MLKQNPFSLYDFLGYFTPGAILLYGCILTLGHTQLDGSVIRFVNQYQGLDKTQFYTLFILIAYISGHFLNFLSSITIECYSNWAFGYPSKYLLDKTHEGYFDVPISQKVLRLIVGFLLGPIVLFDWILGSMGGARKLYVKSLDRVLIAVLRKKIERLITEHAEVEKREDLDQYEFFRYVYHYAVENAPNHLPKMQNYVALFGFLRTITLISVTFFWIAVLHVFNGTFTCGQSIVILVLSAVISFIFFLGFVKFYRRFSLEALMAFAVTYGKQKQKSETE